MWVTIIKYNMAQAIIVHIAIDHLNTDVVSIRLIIPSKSAVLNSS